MLSCFVENAPRTPSSLGAQVENFFKKKPLNSITWPDLAAQCITALSPYKNSCSVYINKPEVQRLMSTCVR